MAQSVFLIYWLLKNLYLPTYYTMPMELSEMTLEEVLRSYSSIKGHRTRCKKKLPISSVCWIPNIPLLRKIVLMTAWKNWKDRHWDYPTLLTIIWVWSTIRPKTMKKRSLSLWKCLTVVLWICLQSFTIATLPLKLSLPPAQLAAPVRPTPKPLTAEFKPNNLAHDATMANYHTWMKQFRAYFDAGHLNTLPCAQQHAYLNNCLDNVLCARVNREASATTPIYSPVTGLIPCI